jgi:homoserine/homoserine lactone efflux protein
MLFVASEIALCISPGPAVFYVTSQALYRDFRTSVAASFGILTGNAVYFLASALGLSALILASSTVFLAVKWLGVAYLLWLGLRMLFGAASLRSAPDQKSATGKAYRGGIVVQLANPKNLIFFVAILPPFIDVSVSIPLQILLLGLTSLIIEITVLLIYGFIGSRAGHYARDSRFAIWIDRVAGAMLVSVAAGLAFIKRAANEN